MQRRGTAALRIGRGGAEDTGGAREDRCRLGPGQSAAGRCRGIRRTLKARHDPSRWLDAAAPLREGLRERQRATLVACLLARLNLADSYALYQHYLIDVDMGPRTLTSRTRLAISSVQLFVQRLLMNLESERVPGDEQARECLAQWASLKNYRVWEAGRKIFLYPENWIEPELRKDKTALFRDLESELMQQELSAEAADQVLRRYLERLEELGRLQVCALAHDPRPGARVLTCSGARAACRRPTTTAGATMGSGLRGSSWTSAWTAST